MTKLLLFLSGFSQYPPLLLWDYSLFPLPMDFSELSPAAQAVSISCALRCRPRDRLERGPSLLFPYYLLYLADLFLNFAGYFFDFAFGFQLGIFAEFPGDFPELTLYFVKRAFCLVLRAGFHGIPPALRIYGV